MRAKNISLREIRYFVAAAECGKLAEAANILAISQSAVTTAIQDLERKIGVPLLVRSTRGISLTLKGYQFLGRAKRLLAELEDAVHSVSADDEAASGAMRLGVTDIVAAYYMPAFLVAFQRSWPRIRVEVIELARERLECGLCDGDLDIGLAIVSPTIDHAALATELLAKLPRHAWVNAEHRLLERQRVEIADFATEPYILLLRDQIEHVTLSRFTALGIQPHIAYRVSSVEAVRSLVANGAGLTVLSDLLYRPWSLEGRRVDKMDIPDVFPGEMEIGLLWLRERRLPPVTAVFRRALRMFSGLPPGFGAVEPTPIRDGAPGKEPRDSRS